MTLFIDGIDARGVIESVSTNEIAYEFDVASERITGLLRERLGDFFERGEKETKSPD